MQVGLAELESELELTTEYIDSLESKSSGTLCRFCMPPRQTCRRAPLQIYLDLIQDKGRGEEAASAILAEVINPPWR